MKQIVFSLSLIVASIGAKAQLFINEVSQGSGGNQEYVEFIAAGTRTCNDSTLDIRGIIFDDNMGWYGTRSANPGCFRFAANGVWSAVPYGSIILVYNSADKNTAITLADDPTDANHDYVYVVADTSSLLEVNTIDPAVASSSFDYIRAITGSWLTAAQGALPGSIDMDDNEDVMSIINPAYSTNVASHSIGWGTLASGGTQTPTIQFPGISASAVNLYNADNDPSAQSSWVNGSAISGASDETPGLGNTSANSAWIDAMRMLSGSAPASPGSISGSATTCVGAYATYTINSVAGATSYNWNIPGGWSGTSSDTSITVTVGSTGMISVEALNGCGVSPAVSLHIISDTAPPVPTITGNMSACEGGTESYSISTVPGLYNTTWTIPPSWSGTGVGNAILCKVGNAGGQVSVILGNACGFTITSIPVSVNTYVTPSVSISIPSTNICNGTPATFMSSAVNGGNAPQYQWVINGMPLAAFGGPSFTTNALKSGDDVSVTLISDEACVTTNSVASNHIKINVLQPVTPAVKITTNHAMPVVPGTVVNFTANYTGGGTSPAFQWYKNGQPILSAIKSTLTASNLKQDDSITVRMISSEPCVSNTEVASNVIRINNIISTGVSDANTAEAAAINFYPNPSNGDFTIKAEWSEGHAMDNVQVEVTNVMGQAIYSQALQPNSAHWTHKVSLGHPLTDGVYYVRLRAKDVQIVRSILIQQ